MHFSYQGLCKEQIHLGYLRLFAEQMHLSHQRLFKEQICYRLPEANERIDPASLPEAIEHLMANQVEIGGECEGDDLVDGSIHLPHHLRQIDVLRSHVLPKFR